MKYCGTTWKENKTPTFSSLSRSNLSETEPDESVTVSAVRIVFFLFQIKYNSWAIIWNFESNQTVIVSLKSHQ